MSTEQISTAPSRKVPPPCWNPDQTLALIHAYREKWFALRRRNLRTADWESVAIDVSRCSSTASLPKSSVQCRHKIEKLRKRYRMEKQRSLAFPGRFFSSWDLFPLLDSMEIAPASVVRSNRNAKKINDDGDEFLVEKLGIRSSVSKLNCKIERRSNPNAGLENDSQLGFRLKSFGGRNSVTPVFKNYSKIEENFDGNLHFDSDSRGGIDLQVPDFDDSQGIESGGGFPVKSLGDRNLVPPVFRSKISGNPKPNNNLENDYGFSTKNYNHHAEGHSTRNVDAGFLNGYHPSSLRSGDGNRPNGGVTRESDPFAEMVSSIKLLGEGYVRMEKMKMEMVREIEKKRMEAEVKRTEMIIESQQKIVDAFVNALLEKKNRKKMKTVV